MYQTVDSYLQPDLSRLFSVMLVLCQRLFSLSDTNMSPSSLSISLIGSPRVLNAELFIGGEH